MYRPELLSAAEERALLAAGTGFCTGCEAYKLGRLLLGRPFVSCPIPPRP